MDQHQDGVIQHTLFEALFDRALRPQGAFAEDLRRVGYDAARPVPRYPVQVFTAALDSAWRHTAPAVQREKAFRNFGRLVGQEFFETFVGKVVGAALPMLGPDRLTQSLPRRLTTGIEGLTASVEKRGEGHYRLIFSSDKDLILEFSAGAIEASLAKTNVKAEVTVDPEHPTTGLIIRW